MSELSSSDYVLRELASAYLDVYSRARTISCRRVPLIMVQVPRKPGEKDELGVAFEYDPHEAVANVMFDDGRVEQVRFELLAYPTPSLSFLQKFDSTL